MKHLIFIGVMIFVVIGVSFVFEKSGVRKVLDYCWAYDLFFLIIGVSLVLISGYDLYKKLCG